MKATLLDWICLAADTPLRPQDFSVVLTLGSPVEVAALQDGARSARNRYPKSGALFRAGEWTPVTGECTEIERRAQTDDFLNGPFDLSRMPPVRQLLRSEGSESVLTTRVHHGAADGASAALWLSHQLQVALGLCFPLARRVTPRNPALRRLRRPQRRSPFAFQVPAEPLVKSRSPGRRRAWKTILLPPAPATEWAGFSLGDTLAAALMEALRIWRIESGRGPGRLGLWFPVDIRRRRWRGFGNGTSRIRLYPSFPPGADRLARSRYLRRQVRWSMRHGEWEIPARNGLQRVPGWALLPLLRWLIRRPSLDYGSAVFTLLRWPLLAPGILEGAIRKIEVVGLLHQRHALAVNGVSLGDRTWLTFTFDPNLLETGDVDFIVEAFLNELAEWRRELLPGGELGQGSREEWFPAGRSCLPPGALPAPRPQSCASIGRD